MRSCLALKQLRESKVPTRREAVRAFASVWLVGPVHFCAPRNTAFPDNARAAALTSAGQLGHTCGQSHVARPFVPIFGAAAVFSAAPAAADDSQFRAAITARVAAERLTLCRWG